MEPDRWRHSLASHEAFASIGSFELSSQALAQRSFFPLTFPLTTSDRDPVDGLVRAEPHRRAL